MVNFMVFLSGLITIIVFLFTSRLIFKFLMRINMISEFNHPYTNEKTYKNYWEFTKIYFFVLVSLVFVFSTFWRMGIALLVLGLLQALAWFVINRSERVEATDSLSIEFDGKDEEEYIAYLKTVPVNNQQKVLFSNKIVLHGDTLYWGKRKKVLIKERRYKYIFMNTIVKKQRIVSFKYGFLGLPLFNKQIYIPTGKDKQYLKIQKRIEEKRQVTTFMDKYKNVFVNSEKNR